MARSSAIIRLYLALILTGAVGRAAAPRPAPPLNLDAYGSALRQLSKRTAELPDHPKDAAMVEESLPRAWSVALDGQQFDISAAWLRGALAGITAHPKQARARAAALQTRLWLMQSAAQNFTTRRDPPTHLAQMELQHILAQRQFQSSGHPDRLRRLRQALDESFVRFLRHIFSGFGRRPGLSGFLLWAMGIVFILVMMGFLMREILGPPGFSRLGLAVPPSKPATWREIARKGAQAAAERDFRNAIRFGYWAAIDRLAERGDLQARRNRTPRDYVRRLPGDYAERAAFLRISSDFERIWYGGHPASGEDFQFMMAQLERLGCDFQ
ncbi:MAG: DUF4129 domain-containing protein [Terriglobia bacterium]